MKNHKPECRYCGTRVEYFGDLCPSCDGTQADEMHQLVLAAANDRMAAEDY